MKLILFTTVISFIFLSLTGAIINDGRKDNSVYNILTNITDISLKERNLFIQAIFTKYGHSGVLSFEGYEHLLENLKIGNIDIIHGWDKHFHNGSKLLNLHKNDHEHPVTIKNGNGEKNIKRDTRKEHNKSEQKLKKRSTFTDQKDRSEAESHDHGEEAKSHDHGKDAESHDHGKDAELHDHNTDAETFKKLKKCFRPSELLHVFGYDEDADITPEQFVQLCPAIIYQVDIKECMQSHTDKHHQHTVVKVEKGRSLSDIPKEVWGLATCAIVVISLAGLLVVSMIPFLRKMLMTSVLQFLVALAVGALSGDALLHLIPHSLQPHKSDNKHDDSDDATHFEGVYKGLCGLAAIYFFVIFGRLQSIIANRKRTKTNRSVKILNVDQDDSHQNKSFMSSSTEKGAEFVKDMIKIELNEIEEHSHGHSHGHSHSVPSSIPALAWRVIIGDGVHNLCDGLAIGVAFANSVTGGISTSIAVLCHELPHEMGDFAVLLTKGMSVKQAILCNCISSMLSLIGMFIGVILGNFGETNLWLFFAVAGMFLYISLVDLIPELSHVPVTGTLKSFKTLLVQISGMLTGSGVMFLIAMFEDDLKTALEF